MKKTIKLTEQEAIKFYNSSSDEGFKQLLENEFGKGFAKPKNIIDLVYDLDTLSDYLGELELPYEQNTKDTLEKKLNAFYILAKVAEVYNQGKEVKFDGSTYYYMPYKYFRAGGGSEVLGSSVWSFCLYTSGCLYYVKSDLSAASYKNFKKYWEDYWGQ